MHSDLQVEVNGQDTFFVSMKLLASFSGKLRKMFTKSGAQNGSIKLILHEFPGGAEGFELIIRFCYNRGRVEITPSNVVLLHSAAEFLEINVDETRKYFENIHLWSWSEILDCLKQCQELLSFIKYSFIVREMLNALVEKISTRNVCSPFSFSCSETQFSGDASTNYSSRSSSFQTTNWLRDLEFLNIDLFEKVLSTMISNKLDNGIICSFLLHYQNVKFIELLPKQKCKCTKVVINTLSLLHGDFKYPFRSLCDVLQVCLRLKMGKYWVKRVEKMIGSRLDEATLDDLLVPSKTCAYDVNFILRLLKIFLGENREYFFMQRLRKVVCLVDLYLAEVAPDPRLNPRKFLALVLGLPRESHDGVCEVIHVYIKVHKFMSEEEKMMICSSLDYDKLSSESLVKLIRNSEFPVCAGACARAALIVQQSELKTQSKDDEILEFRGNSLSSANEDEHILLRVRKNSSNVPRINVTCPRNGKSLPRLCS